MATRTDSEPPWRRAAVALPVAFAQVREDPLLDQQVVGRIGPGAVVARIASGGCTAAFLAATGTIGRLHLIDANPAQLALTRLKLRLLRTAPRCWGTRRCRRPIDVTGLRRSCRRSGCRPRRSAPGVAVAALGPDHAGRYEQLFAALRAEFAGVAAELGDTLRLADPARRVAPGTRLGDHLDASLDSVLALPNLVRLFGAEATNNPAAPFARHFAGRIRHAIGTRPAADNPYLWQMLAGRSRPPPRRRGWPPRPPAAPRRHTRRPAPRPSPPSPGRSTSTTYRTSSTGSRRTRRPPHWRRRPRACGRAGGCSSAN
ncbi:MAG TPA: DUF3419 family protein [Urbifossiella sp.]|nr:DUF3419 family protein [Urbifossiella sp.]